VPSIVTGVSASSSHRPSPSVIHRIRRNIAADAVAPRRAALFLSLLVSLSRRRRTMQMVVGEEDRGLRMTWQGGRSEGSTERARVE
jgi:hypothetical protein